MKIDNLKPIAERSPKWAKVRKDFLKLNPTCAVCGGSLKLEVHHIKVFHLFPELELEPNNLITLCENGKMGVNCHLSFGHLGSYKSYNETIKSDAKKWNGRFKNRP
jgi:5-methylcytosine-specific restriction endonuclease McrA